jgi:hypothetical protein
MDAIVRLVEEGRNRKEGADAHASKNWVPIDRDGKVPLFYYLMSELAVSRL